MSHSKIFKFLMAGILCFIISGCKLSGKICDEKGNGIAGVTVALSYDSTTKTETTDSDGNYTFSNLNPGTYKITPAPGDYQFLPEYLDVVKNDDNDVTGLNFVGIKQNSSVQWKYSQIFNDGPGIPNISGAEINDSAMRTLTFPEINGNGPFNDDYGLYTDDDPDDNIGGFMLQVSEVPHDFFSETTFKFTHDSKMASISQSFRVIAPGTISNLQILSIGAFLDKSNNVIFNFGGHMYNLGTYADWANRECRQIVKVKGGLVQGEIYRDGKLLKYCQKEINFINQATGTNMTVMLNDGIHLRKLAFADQPDDPFTPVSDPEKYGNGTPYSEPDVIWAFSQIFDEGSGAPDISGAEINNSSTRTMSLLTGNALLDSYGVYVPEGSSVAALGISEMPDNFRAETVIRISRTDEGTGALLCKTNSDSSHLIGTGIIFLSGTAKLHVVIINENVSTFTYSYDLGDVSDWINVECRLLTEIVNDCFQFTVYKNGITAGRYQSRYIRASDFSGLLGSAFLTEGVGMKSYRFAGNTQTPFNGPAINPVDYNQFLMYQDFTKSSGLLCYNPPEYRKTCILEMWNWFLPPISMSLDRSPSMVKGKGLQGTADEFDGYIYFTPSSTSLVEAEIEYPLTPNNDMIFEIGNQEAFLQYIQSTHELRIVNYTLNNEEISADNKDLTPFAYIGSYASILGSTAYTFSPGSINKMGIKCTPNNVIVYINNAEIINVSRRSEIKSLASLRGAHCEGLYVKNIGIKNN